jgi:RHS repeat-associated protein
VRILGESEGAERGAGVLLKVDGVNYVPVYDLVGNILQLQNMSGRVVDEYDIDLFGVEANVEGAEPISPWRYSSKRVDEETGFVYFGHRYYDSVLGRWVTADPQGYAAGPNLYAYVMNNPVAHMDQYGLVAETPRDAGRNRFGRSTTKTIQIGRNRHVLGAVRAYVETPQPKEGGGNGTTQKCGAVRTDQLEVTNRDILYHEVGKKHILENIFLAFINGVDNSLEDAKVNAKMISRAFSKMKVYVLHNPTNGIMIDIFGAGVEMTGIYSGTCQSIEQGMMQICDMNPGKNGLVFAHSRGALICDRILDKMPREYNRRLSVFTFGGAHIIKPGRGLMGCMNYVSSRDGIPFICSLFTMASHLLGNSKDYLRVVKGQGIYGIDHAFTGATYEKAIQRIGRHYINAVR